MDAKKRVYNQNPYNKANILSRLFMCWIAPLLLLGRKKTLDEDDLYVPVPSEQTKYLTDRLEKEWAKELQKPKPSLAKAIFRLYVLKILSISSLLFIREGIRVAQPILIGLLIDFFSGQITLETALVYGGLLSLSVLVNNVVTHPNSYMSERYGYQMRVSVCGLIYRKMMRLSTVQTTNKSNVEVINLMSNDATRIEYMPYFSSYLIVSPLQAIVIIYMLVSQVDYTILGGLAALGIIIPFQVLMGKVYDRYKLKTLKRTDERINLTSEILNGIKVLKQYCWEEAFEKIIENIRIKELKSQSMVFVTSAINSIFDTDSPPFITFISIAIFVGTTNTALSPNTIVIVTSYYMLIATSIQFFFIRGLIYTIGGLVSIKRVQDYLLLPEVLKPESLQAASEAAATNNGKTEVMELKVDDLKYETTPYIRVKNLNASWKESKTDFLRNISFNLESNEFLAIVGTVGSGKSSLLMALLGEMPIIKGDIDINGSIFYVSQEPWIFSATVRQNILFGKEYDEDRFNRVAEVCALTEDLEMLPYGDLTYIGDKGVNLSGGQRARVSLARALYADADIYILDDPLSAVDAHVGKHLYNVCVNDYLRSKIRILVTHQVHFLTNAEKIILLKDGCVQGKGSYEELIAQSSELSLLLGNTKKVKASKHEKAKIQLRRKSKEPDMKKYEAEKVDEDEDEDEDNEDEEDEEEEKEENDNEEYDEKREIGAVGWAVYKTYLNAAFGIIGPIVLVFLFTGSQALLLGADYWVAYWASEEDRILTKYDHNCTVATQMSSNDTICVNNVLSYSKRSDYFTIYTAIAVSAFMLAVVRSGAYFGFALITTKTLHERMFSSVMQTKIRFFDLNPIGRIMNRFSKDVGNLDDVLPLTLFDFCQYSMLVAGTIVLAVIVNYWILIPLVPLTVAFMILRTFYIKSSREIKRVEGLCRSPIFMHANNTSTGIVTIRASKSQEILCREYEVHSDYHTQAYFGLSSVSTWFAVHLDMVVTLYTCIVVFGCILLKNNLGLNPGEVGIVLVYLFQIMGVFQWCVQLSAHVENLMTSAERVSEYTLLDKENLKKGSRKPPPNWPQTGEIQFKDVSFAYDENLSYVLKNVSFTLNGKEKIGVVGRTGAGKSTIFQTLYRMSEPDGTVLIDGVNIKELSLHDLRNKLSIIPQEPTLFIGPLRYNLDPFGKYSDNELWDTLEIVQLKDAVKNMQGGLDAQISKAGSNMSVGQKQLICLARAILKKSKILIIDEATANVDYKTDELVQKAIRECFGECTVITIAHRLHTIMDSDRIICLSDGCLMDIGRPYDLLHHTDGILYKLVQRLGPEEFKRLLAIAENHVRKTMSPDLRMNSPDGGIVSPDTRPITPERVRSPDRVLSPVEI